MQGDRSSHLCEGDEVAPFSPKTSTDLCVYLRGYKAIVLCHLGAIFLLFCVFFFNLE